MGVLSIALPVTGRQADRRAIRATFPKRSSTTRSTPDNPAPIPVIPTGSRGKLVQPLKPVEIMLERTPEQEAAQEAVARLVRQCIAGDAQAWQQLVVSQHRRIYAICYRFTGSSSDAEDLTQDVFLKLYKNLASFDLQKGSFQTWITTLARNLLVDHFRRTRLDRASDSLDATFDGEEDGPTMADRLADTRDSQEQQFSSLELNTYPGCPQTTLTGVARGCYSAGPRGYGLQGDCPGSPDTGRNCEKPHQSRSRGTCKTVTTYRKTTNDVTIEGEVVSGGRDQPIR